MEIKLNPQQCQAVERMKDFLTSAEDLFLLKGFAGTGKTTTIQSLIYDLQSRKKKLEVALTAPTNKAVKVLERMSRIWGLGGVDTMTIHQLLGLQLKPSRTGGMQLEAKGISLIGYYDLIVLDEASMVNAELWTLIQTRLEQSLKVKLICMGDPAQLPPVGEVASNVFGITQQAELTEVVRQDQDNPITTLVDRARQRIYDPGLVLPPVSHHSAEGGVWWIKKTEWLHHLIAAFKSEGFTQDPDHVRALAWTNRACDGLNDYIRTAIYGADSAPFVEGELLIAKEPIFDEDDIILSTSSECRVVKVGRALRDNYQCWHLTVTTDESFEYELYVLKGEERDRYVQALQNLEQMARQEWTKRNWKAYFYLKQRFASLDYGYAITIHKSQGSTFQNVFVVDRDIDHNPNWEEAAQCRYVAYSRAAKRLFNLF